MKSLTTIITTSRKIMALLEYKVEIHERGREIVIELEDNTTNEIPFGVLKLVHDQIKHTFLKENVYLRYDDKQGVYIFRIEERKE